MPNPIDDKPEVFIEFPSRAVGTADLQTDTAKLFLMGYLQHPRQQPGRDALPAEPGSNGDVVNLNLVRNKPEYNITCNQLNVPSGKPSNQYVGTGVGRLGETDSSTTGFDRNLFQSLRSEEDPFLPIP